MNDLDQALERGQSFLTYVRYLDDMVVLVPDSERGRRWADRALERIRLEAEAIGVSINQEKTRIVKTSARQAAFTFLGFGFRWKQSPRAGRWYAYLSPRAKKVIAVLRAVRKALRKGRHLKTREAIEQVNAIVRGWVNYFRVGNSGDALNTVKYHVERQVRRFMARKRNRRGFGWRRWSSDVVYERWGLFNDYRVVYLDKAKVGRQPKGIITPIR